MARWKIGTIALAMVLLPSLWHVPEGLRAQTLTMPNRFFGDVLINGTPAPAGTNVEAAIGDNVCGQTEVRADSTYVLDVVSSSQVAGCGTAGATVDFTVGGGPAGNATWSSGLFSPLDLTYALLLAPTPMATTMPTPTPTSSPPSYEVAELVAGCTPVATTYPDGTPIGTIDGAVSPPGVLEALWEFEAGAWLGFSPLFPEGSDLGQVDLLDVVFICVAGSTSGTATFTRPMI